MMIRNLLTWMILSCVLAIPEPGCLLYRDKTCVICDNVNKYYKVGDICTKKELTDCKKSFDGEKCQECEEGFYIDFQNQTCVSFPNEIRKVANCKTFKYETDCVSCEDNFYLKLNKCFEIDTVIQNCIVYTDSKTCSKCEGSVLTNGGKECAKFEDPNCMSVSTIKCAQCKDNYTLYKNKYLYDFQTWTVNKLRKYDIYNVINPYYSTCVAMDLANCAVYETFDTCRECTDDFFRDPNGKCILLPEEPILNCFEYQSQGVCIECLEGFYIKSESECEPHGLTINLCEKMSMEIKDLCEKCAEGYFLNSNSCVERRVIVNQCKNLNPILDQCSECEDGYILNSNFSKCMIGIDNCKAYDKLIESITCNDCNTGFYYHQEARCAKVAVTIEGCLDYKSNQNFTVINDLTYHCQKCQDKYYMENAICEPHTIDVVTAINCNEFSQQTLDTCTACKNSEINFTAENYCKAVTDQKRDTNCSEYSGEGKCIACNTGYYAISDKCLKITIENCTSATDNGKLCNNCVASTLENFHISFDSADNHCNFSHKHIIHNCIFTNTVSTNTGSSQKNNTNICDQCMTPYYPTSFDKQVKFCVPKSKIKFNYGDSLNYENCNIYEPILKECRECSFNSLKTVKRVIDNIHGSCQDECITYYNVDNTPKPSTILLRAGEQFFKCSETIVIANCKIEAVDVKTLASTDKLCYECKAGYLPLLIFANIDEPEMYKDVETYDYIPAFQAGHFKTKSVSYDEKENSIMLFPACKKIEDSVFLKHAPDITNQLEYTPYILETDYSTAGTLYARCRFALSFEDPENTGTLYYGCGACKWGTSGYSLLITFGTLNTWSISTCDIMSECDLGTYHQGLTNAAADGFLNMWVSCHVCLNASKIGRRIGATNAGTVGAALKNFYTQTSCQNPGFGSSISPTFPTNCAIQEIIAEVAMQEYNAAPTVANIVGTNPLCSACKPGYKPIVIVADTTNYITKCEEIENCDPVKGLNMFNKCLFCKEGYVLNDERDACLLNSIKNCYIGFPEEQKRICSQCKEGYVTTPDKHVCNSVVFNNCLKLKRLSLPDTNNPPYIGDGCVECELGYLAFIPDLTQSLCVRSDNIVKRVFTSAGVMNCRTYASREECSVCTVGFIKPTNSSTKCVLTSTITNCENYNATETCTLCKPRFLLKGGNCLDGGEYISNCDRFESETKCETCSDGFIPVQFGLKVVCYNVDNSLTNCAEYDLTKTLNKTLKCNKCHPHFYPITVSTSLTSCVGIPLINNCKTYDLETFKCVECNTGYYIENPISVSKLQKCQKITVNAKNTFSCKIFDKFKDSCEQCYPGYYVRNSICEFKPTGVIGCAVYLDTINCSKCKDKHYLLGNNCRSVPDNNYIFMCLYYSDENNCSDCEPGYWLRDNKCFGIEISNCDLLDTEKKCKICKDQFFLNSRSTCDKGTVADCKLHASQNACQLCDSNYFVNTNKTCEKINENSLISDCRFYIDATLCKQCKNNAILSKDLRSCLTIDKLDATDPLSGEVENDCDGYEYKTECKICNPGYLFEENICTPCSDKFTGDECRFCDPQNRSTCYICQPGNYMDAKGKCHIPEVDEEDKSENIDEGDDNKEGIRRLSLWIFIVSLVWRFA